MAWRIDEAVVSGELNNRVDGIVTGTIWLAGRSEPLQLALEGNPWRDWAGCVLRFTHDTPIASDLDGLTPEQIGVCGDLTVSRKVRIPPEPVREWILKGAPGRDSLPWGNCVYLEWFSETNGRVVIESTHYKVELSAPAWTMLEEQEAEQRRRNADAMTRFMQRLQIEFDKASGAAAASPEPCPPEPVPESDASDAGRAFKLISEIEALKRKTHAAGGLPPPDPA